MCEWFLFRIVRGNTLLILLTGFLDQELLSLRKFEVYRPVDIAQETPAIQKTESGPSGKYMVLGDYFYFLQSNMRIDALSHVSF